MKTFEIATKRSKRRQYIKFIASSLCLLVVATLLCYKVLTYFVYNNARDIEERYLLQMRIAYPNIYSYNGQYKPISMLSGIYHERYKDLCGVQIYYDDYNVVYGIQGKYNIFANMFNGNPSNNDGRYKIPVFFNAHATKSDEFVIPIADDKDELRYVSQMPNQLVELAVTFDKEYTYDEIQAMVPPQLKINWYWIGTQYKEELLYLPIENTFGTNDYGLQTGRFLPSLEQAVQTDKYHLMTTTTSKKGKIVTMQSSYDDIKAYLKKHGQLDTTKEDDKKQMTFSGVILTGRSENFLPLENENWIYSSSIGASIPNQPYHKLEKE